MRWLVIKEWRELLSARAWWVMIALTGPLVGVTFTNAVRSFSEVSEGAGTACGLACAPLIGVWGPTFSAFEIVAIFLLPFVAIRVVAGDRQSCALTLELQRPLASMARVGAKMIVLLAGWSIGAVAALAAVALWASYGGSVYAPELAAAALGQALNASLTIALAIAVASMTDHPSTAAVVTLGITIGTWIVDFAAAIHGGIWDRLAAFTPAAMVGRFQHGLIEIDVVLIDLLLVLAGWIVGALWLRVDRTVRWRSVRAAAVAGAVAVVAFASSRVPGSWDLSESRQNSFSEADEQALARIREPLTIEAHLAAQDPRRAALERGPFAKLRRALPAVRIAYVARTSTGVYEQADANYGEIVYRLGSRRDSSRVITDEGVMESVLAVAGIAPAEGADAPYPGHALVATPRWAGWVFYVAWPVLVGAIMMFRRHV